MSWQPIETAPKDGTGLLLWNGEITSGKFDHEYDQRWEVLCTGSWAEDAVMHPQPTHWMPLPDAPKEGEG